MESHICCIVYIWEMRPCNCYYKHRSMCEKQVPINYLYFFFSIWWLFFRLNSLSLEFQSIIYILICFIFHTVYTIHFVIGYCCTGDANLTLILRICVKYFFNIPHCTAVEVLLCICPVVQLETSKHFSELSFVDLKMNARRMWSVLLYLGYLPCNSTKKR